MVKKLKRGRGSRKIDTGGEGGPESKMSCAEKPELESGQKEKVGISCDNFGNNCDKNGGNMECEIPVCVEGERKTKKKRVLPEWMLKKGKDQQPLGGEEKINLKKMKKIKKENVKVTKKINSKNKSQKNVKEMIRNLNERKKIKNKPEIESKISNNIVCESSKAKAWDNMPQPNLVKESGKAKNEWDNMPQPELKCESGRAKNEWDKMPQPKVICTPSQDRENKSSVLQISSLKAYLPTRTREPTMPRTTIFPMGMRKETTASKTAPSPSPTQCGETRPTSVGGPMLAGKPTSEACKPTKVSTEKTAPPPLIPSPMEPAPTQRTPLPQGRVTKQELENPLSEAQVACKPANGMACKPTEMDSDEETERLMIEEQERVERIERIKKKEELERKFKAKEELKFVEEVEKLEDRVKRIEIANTLKKKARAKQEEEDQEWLLLALQLESGDSGPPNLPNPAALMQAGMEAWDEVSLENEV